MLDLKYIKPVGLEKLKMATSLLVFKKEDIIQSNQPAGDFGLMFYLLKIFKK
mgnify:CR=1 FL=1